jgi:hypothetical protein
LYLRSENRSFATEVHEVLVTLLEQGNRSPGWKTTMVLRVKYLVCNVL